MNLVGSYAHHHHHHHHHHPHPAHPMLHEPFLFGPASRCHQERPYFQSWLLSPADAAPDFPTGGPPPTAAAAAAAYNPDARPGQSPGRLETLGGRLGRRKGSGPKKERRRTESINSAFAELRECIPNVPADTKLSKIKTLRLATSYIAYLMDVLAKDAQAGDPEAFKAELKKADGGRESKRKRELLSWLPERTPDRRCWHRSPALTTSEARGRARVTWRFLAPHPDLEALGLGLGAEKGDPGQLRDQACAGRLAPASG
ncbi:heart- and neural crest derivatives-expressed protein 1 isoform X1 [Manis javanica]|uniref:heart- and neural crest derivatives-expressed protein 1 isoform X1 n=1 Tax=Manis javanica TaxID=9974 RepID=UPI003C6D2F1D